MNDSIEVMTKISKDEVMSALRAITVENKGFNPDVWSLGEAETLLRAATMVRREILLKDPERYRGQLGLIAVTPAERGTETCNGQTRGSCRTNNLSILWWCDECIHKGQLKNA